MKFWVVFRIKVLILCIIGKRGKKVKKDPTPEKKLEGFIKLIGMTNPKIVDITKKTGLYAFTLVSTKKGSIKSDLSFSLEISFQR